MATHASILAWRIPWAEEPGGLQSMGLQRVRHDWSEPGVEPQWKAEWPECRGFSGLWNHSSRYYWVGQKVCLGFSVRCDRKTQTNFLPNTKQWWMLIILHLSKPIECTTPTVNPRPMHTVVLSTTVHFCAVYNSQNTEATLMFVERWWIKKT